MSFFRFINIQDIINLRYIIIFDNSSKPCDRVSVFDNADPKVFQNRNGPPALPLAHPMARCWALKFEFSGRTAKNRFMKAAMSEKLSSWDALDIKHRDIPSKQWPKSINVGVKKVLVSSIIQVGR
jgi:hypothetical protein